MFHFPRFPPLTLCIQVRVCRVHLQGFPHSDILGSKVACHLPGAYRRLPRPSSALHCQAIHRTPLRASAIQTLVTCPDEHRGLREPERNRNGCALIRCNYLLALTLQDLLLTLYLANNKIMCDLPCTYHILIFSRIVEDRSVPIPENEADNEK